MESYALDVNETNSTQYSANIENSREIKEITPAGDTYKDIQDAIYKSSSGDVILLDKDNYYSNVDYIFVDKPLTIRGNSPSGMPTLDSKFSSVAFIIGESASFVTISNCRIINGNGSSGSAIFVQSSDVTIENCVFENNRARGGGAVYTVYEVDKNPNCGRNLVVKDCDFINNFATHAAGALGVYGNHSKIVNCNFISNRVFNIQGDSNAIGGAIQVGRDEVEIYSEILNCTFIGNSVDTPSKERNAHGGAGCVRKGISYSDCVFINNSAGEGGALTFHASADVYNCRFVNNTAADMGGAISTGWVEMDMDVVLSSCEFEGNKAPFGGAIQMNGENIRLVDSRFVNNTASQCGGAIHIHATTTELESNEFEDNTAGVNGGAIYINGENSLIESNEFISNEAIPNPLFFNDGLGGAIYINGSSAEILKNQFRFNTARNGSAVYFDKNGDRCVISDNIMYCNQAWVYSLPVFAENRYYGESTKIESVIYGGNNIGDIDNLGVSNAIYNNAEYSKIEINGAVPVKGATETGELYQDTREYNIDILLTVVHEDGTVVHNSTQKSDVWGKISVTLENLKPGLYKVSSAHFEDDYYKAITNTTEFRISPHADTEAVKDSNSEEFNYQDYVVWTLNIRNNGPNDATGVKVSDVLPEGLIWIRDTGNGSYDHNTGQWNIGFLASSSSASMDIVCLINKTGFLVNRANVTANEHDFNLNNNFDSADIYVNPAADLSIIKTVNSTNPNYGDMIKWTLKVTNNGPDSASNVIVDDILSHGLVYLSSSEKFDGKWNVGTLESGQSRSLEIICLVNSTGEFSNVASVSADEFDPNLDDNEDEEAIAVSHAADLSIIKTVNSTTANYLDLTKWTIEVTNNGPDTAHDVVVRDVIPQGLDIVSASEAFLNNSWNVGSLDVGESRTLEIVCLVNKTGEFLNVAEVHADEFDPNMDNNLDNESVVVFPASDLAVEKTVNSTHPSYGEYVKWTVKLTNNGPDIATGVKVQDLIPDGLVFIRYCSSSGSYSSQDGIWEVGFLGVGSSEYLNIFCLVNKTGFIVNAAEATGNEYDPNMENNDDAEGIIVIKTVDLAVLKSVSNQYPDYLNEITWTLVVSNNGPDDATGVVVRDVLPEGLVFLGSDGDYLEGSWNVGQLAAGQSKELNILCFVNRTGSIVNIAKASGNEFDLDLTNNEDRESVSVRKSADLVVEKTVSKYNFAVGDVVEYQIKATNNGPDTADNVVLKEYLDENLEIMEYSASGGEFDMNTSTWKLESLGSGQSSYLTVKAKAVAEGMATNRVSVTSDTYDYDLSNNNASACVSIEKSDLDMHNKSAVKSLNELPAGALSEMEKTGGPVLLMVLAILLFAPVFSKQFYKKK